MGQRWLGGGGEEKGERESCSGDDDRWMQRGELSSRREPMILREDVW